MYPYEQSNLSYKGYNDAYNAEQSITTECVKGLNNYFNHYFIDERILKMLRELINREFTTIFDISKDIFCKVYVCGYMWCDIDVYDDAIYDARYMTHSYSFLMTLSEL